LSQGLHEECGVFGIYAAQTKDLASPTYYGLYALQHRGQESCGIAVSDGKGNLRLHKALGLVKDVFTRDILRGLGTGTLAAGHVRYATTGNTGQENAQPILLRRLHDALVTVHNGNLVNAAELRRELELRGSLFHTTTDTEVIAYTLARELKPGVPVEEAVALAMDRLEGAYALILLYGDKLIAVRDPHGFRPLCFGKTADGDYVAASESCALDAVDAQFIRDVEPGEIVVFDASGVTGISGKKVARKPALCVFEYIYFARPDSVLDGVGVHQARINAGRYLAQEHPVQADVVIGVPDSGLDAAIGFSMASGIPYDTGFIKNKYIGRTFIAPGQTSREDKVRIKLNPVTEVVRGKRIVLIDDSIVRGTTSARIVRLLRDAGAREIHLRVTAPPFLNPCYYGTDVDSRENLIACRHTVEEIAKILGADSLGYLNVKYLPYLCGKPEGCGICAACFDGLYPTRVPEGSAKMQLENMEHAGDGR